MFESRQEGIFGILKMNSLLTTFFTTVLNCCNTHSYYYIFLINLVLVMLCAHTIPLLDAIVFDEL